MSLFREWRRWLRLVSSERDISGSHGVQELPPLLFATITEVATSPVNDCIRVGDFYHVVKSGRSKWALFLCPCGCSAVITLSLQRMHHPHWGLRHGATNRPTLRPSIWRDAGCLSHFWVEEGRIHWCNNTGSAPRRTRDNLI